ncbi:MAG: polyprenyl synthetase family protein [Magnetococcales bacterium]|nr:polyprenyl synthetase family protein [Magnetococcales bacterium]NGZ28271.1 polyprenyl synthetase family protein [Magnetococcales bacterium]
MNLKDYLNEKKSLVEKGLDTLTPAADKPPARLNQAMRYSLLAGGKRLRPILVLAAAEAVGASCLPLLPFACAMECIHTYSLIHDDLPAMDDDDLRRGLPTCHKQFDEATAILAGDGLLTLAFQLATSPMEGVTASTQLTAIHYLARDAGIFGMVGGQMFDLLAEGRQVELAELQNIHIHKTGALIRCATVCGAMLAGGTPDQVHHLNRYGEAIGIAFQIVDDILDEIGDTSQLGKTAGSDRRKQKSTYTQLMGISRARQEAQNYVDEALHALADFPSSADPLRELARYILSRSQ